MSVNVSDEEVIKHFPGFHINYDNLEHFRGLVRQELWINRCQDCKRWIYPNKSMCPQCWSSNVVAEKTEGRGVVYLHTKYASSRYHWGPPIPEVDYSHPFAVAAAELPEQKALRYVAPLVNCSLDDIHIGMPVELTWVQMYGHTVPAWQPCTTASTSDSQ